MVKVTFAVVLLFGAVGRGRVVQGQTYTFTKVADSVVDDFDPTSSGGPSISDEGHVAFKAARSDHTAARVLRSAAGLMHPLTVICDTSINEGVETLPDNVSVNNAGQVAFRATISLPGIDQRILRGTGGSLDIIAEAGSNHELGFLSVVVSINDSGTVAWQGEFNGVNRPEGLFTGDGGLVTTIFRTDASMFTSSFAGPAMNNAGQIAFRASTASTGGDAIFRYDGGALYATIADASGPLNHTFNENPAINSTGRAAVIGLGDDLMTTYLVVGTGTAPPAAVVDTTGGLSEIFAAGINDSGQIAFLGERDDFITGGIFTGPDLVKDKVIQRGDALDGSTVLSLSFFREGLNSAGDIAFLAQLADGRGVVMVASPIGPACRADFNSDGMVNSQDVFDFLGVFFAGGTGSDFNRDGVVNSQDFFDFVGVFLAGC